MRAASNRRVNGCESARFGSITVTWKEDVRIWHPGQTWIWTAGGLGVFDPGINALSILTRIVPRPLVLKSAELSYPRNSATPIAANLSLTDSYGTPVRAEFDFLQTGPQTWNIDVDTDCGRSAPVDGRQDADYRRTGGAMPHPRRNIRTCTRILPNWFTAAAVDVDIAPLQLVADAFLCGRRIEVEPFVE